MNNTQLDDSIVRLTRHGDYSNGGSPEVRQLGAGGCIEWLKEASIDVGVTTFKPRRLQKIQSTTATVVDTPLNRTEHSDVLGLQLDKVPTQYHTSTVLRMNAARRGFPFLTYTEI